jgi:hypothetical protein
MKVDTNITKSSYVLKRLRDSGYKADKLIGVSDPKSLSVDLKKLTGKLFPDKKAFYGKDILETLEEFKTEFIRCMFCPPSYSEYDSRCWTILIDAGGSNVFLTFYKNAKNIYDKYEDYGSDYFEIFDGGQFVRPIKKRITTLSFEVICQELMAHGVGKKMESYK